MEINQDIISEIKGAAKDDSKMKDFLIWLVNFEKEHLDRERPGYRAEITQKLDEIVNSENNDVKKK